MITKVIVTFMLIVLYIAGGAAVEVIFDSHPTTAFFGFVMGVISWLSIDCVENRIRKEQQND